MLLFAETFIFETRAEFIAEDNRLKQITLRPNPHNSKGFYRQLHTFVILYRFFHLRDQQVEKSEEEVFVVAEILFLGRGEVVEEAYLCYDCGAV